MPHFQFADFTLPYANLQGFTPPAGVQLTANQQNAIDFAARWMQGQQEFTMHTSGSTGEPKAIQWKRSLMEYSAKQTIQVIGIQETDKAFLCLSVHTAGGCMMLVRALIANIPIMVVEPTGNPMEQLPPKHDYMLASFVPLQMHHILSGYDISSVQKLNRFRKILVGGATMSYEWTRRFTDLDPDFYHTYGMTETYSHIALRKMNGVGENPRFIPMPGVQVSKDKNDRMVINGFITGYADVVTNDRVRTFTDGSFEVLGRIDNVINSGGIKIQLEKVDDGLARLKQLRGRELFTWYLPDAELGQKLVAVIKGEPLDAMDEYEAKVDLRFYLEKYEIPKQFFYTSAFVLTQSGKIQRQRTMDLIDI